MSKEWVTWKGSRMGGMGEKSKLAQKWMKSGGNVTLTMLTYPENLVIKD